MADTELDPDSTPASPDPTPLQRAQGKGKSSTNPRPRKQQVYKKEDVLLRFHSCGRCGLFLSGYRLHHETEFEQAITEIDGDWLPLPWAADMRDLVNKSYGCRTDIETYYLEGTCPECKRPFAYAEPHPDQSAWFVVKM